MQLSWPEQEQVSECKHTPWLHPRGGGRGRAAGRNAHLRSATRSTLQHSIIYCFRIMGFLASIWACSHSSLAPTQEIGAIWPPKGILVLDPLEIPVIHTVIHSLTCFCACKESCTQGGGKGQLCHLDPPRLRQPAHISGAQSAQATADS